IEQQLPEDEVREFRPRFEAELAYGRRYQDAYQHYEQDQISNGAAIDDPHFYDAFFAQHDPIASPLGDAETFVAERGDYGLLNELMLASALFFAGLFAFGAAWVVRARKQALTRISEATRLSDAWGPTPSN